MFRPNVKEFIIWEQIKSLLGVARLTYIYIKISWFITKPCNIMAPGRKETRALFPHLSPPLYISHSLSLLTVSHPLSLSPLLHCFPMALSVFGFPAAHRTSTRSQEHAKYVPTQFLHVVIFSKYVTTRQLGARLAGGDLKRHYCLTRMSF